MSQQKRTKEVHPIALPERARVAFVSTYPPRQCGIATFCQDLFMGLKEVCRKNKVSHTHLRIVTIDAARRTYDYPSEVRLQIRGDERSDYREAADLLNLSPIDVVSLQHEFGLFGGDDGNYVVHFLRALKKPVVTTLHTVLEDPSAGQRETLKAILTLSTRVVVMAHRAVEMLTRDFHVPAEKVVMIHHGTPDVPFIDPAYYKEECGTEGRRMLLTFGLLSPNKGIECAIEALAKVAPEFPDVLYVVLGATHPEVKKRFGENYRLSLERLIKAKGLEDNVTFRNQFVTKEQLIKYLLATDIYLTPYLAKQQITSGTLAYAVATGKAVVSTPYWYAEELLSNGRGVLVPFKDPDAMADQLRTLLFDEHLRGRIRKRAYQFGREMTWEKVAAMYLDVFQEAMDKYGAPTAKVPRVRAGDTPLPLKVSLRHLRAITDHVGMFQHTFFLTPDRNHGYCTDDNVRALITSVMNWNLFQDESVLPLIQTYLAFVRHAINEVTGRVRNFMSYDRRWMEQTGSEDSHGRTVWALGHCVAHGPTEAVISASTRLFNRVLPASHGLRSPRASAYTTLGCLEYLKRFGGDREARKTAYGMTEYLAGLLKANASKDWVWFEDILTYANARLPQALIGAGRDLGDKALLQAGLESLEWLLSIQTDPEGHLSLVGTRGWYPRGGVKATFDQQPVELAGLIDACFDAYLSTGDDRWFSQMEQSFRWFLGRNDRGEPLCDVSEGSCSDGLTPAGINKNRGAEATLSYLMSLQRMLIARKEPKAPSVAVSSREGVPRSVGSRSPDPFM